MSIYDELMGKKKRVVSVSVERDEFTDAVCNAFDFNFTGRTEFVTWEKPNVPKDFSLGLIVGKSGSGKTLLLKEFGTPDEITWSKKKAIVSQTGKTPDQAMDALMSVGLNSKPNWVCPFKVLSMGEQYRANVARTIRSGAVYDEFTSVVDRDTAKSLSVSLRRHIDDKGLKGVVVATCHEDIIEWLQPDWVFNSNTGELSVGRSLRTPIELQIFRSDTSSWGLFAPYHYLSHSINPAARCYVATWEGKLVGFSAVLPFPSAIKHAWRGHRTVVFPKFQGMGIGVRLSDAMGEILLAKGKRYFSRTAHPRMGQYRENSALWRATTKNLVYRTDNRGTIRESMRYKKGTVVPKEDRDIRRVCYSHEYIGQV